MICKIYQFERLPSQELNDIESAKPCPHCDAELESGNGIHCHPINGCLMQMLVLRDEDIPKWNQRAEAARLRHKLRKAGKLVSILEQTIDLQERLRFIQ